MTPASSPWHRLSAALVAAGIAGALNPVPASAAAPAGAVCAGPERYAAEANARLLHLRRLDLRPAGQTGGAITDVGLATAASAMVAQSAVNSAAAARLLDGRPTGHTAPNAPTRPLYQQAPPSNAEAQHTEIAAQAAGPVALKAGRLTSHARWDPAMACGGGAGEVTRAQASSGSATILTGRAGRSLVAVPRGLQSLSTTALERRGANVHTVARASVAGPGIRLLGDAVRVAVVRTPHLTASISASRGSADVRYFPPTLEISGRGFATRRLEAAGDLVEFALPKGRARTESAPSVPGEPLRALLSTVRPGAVRGLLPAGTATDPLLPGLPPRPGVPPLPAGTPESVDPRPDGGGSGGAEDVLRISIGDVRQAAAGHAVAARAVSVHVQIIARRSSAGRGGVVLDADLGVLEAAAVAPDPGTAGGAGVQPGASGDTGGRLPVTGSSVDLTLFAGSILLVTGSVFLWFGLRKRPRG